MPKQLKGNRKPIPKGNKGLAKLKKVAPQVVAKMGYKKGGLAASLKKLKRSQGSSIEGEISPRMKRRIDQKIKDLKNVLQSLIDIQQSYAYRNAHMLLL